jgi:hypothetical protein
MANGATTGTTTATATATGTVAAPSLLMRPFAWIPEARRPQVAITVLILLALAFPFFIDSNDADVDSMANAAAYATLALGLNIVVGFAGLLDLGYAAFFAIGAYTYGILTAFQLQPPWNAFWDVFQTLGLATPVPADSGWPCHWPRHWRRSSACCSACPRCGCAATTWRSSPWASARSPRSWCATGRTLPMARPD